ncbi:hypothetical protein TRIUR3_11657 [Triticum urartu]|uniref:Uncharacterized protein n=1 Tax=Triticum urartu TaxID=4572 RepID=M7ZEP8_TRIUA|nr:hypothetical protein TRIUR3_11657 [Triticum urartu]
MTQQTDDPPWMLERGGEKRKVQQGEQWPSSSEEGVREERTGRALGKKTRR